MLFIRCLITLIGEVFSLHAEVLQNLLCLCLELEFSHSLSFLSLQRRLLQGDVNDFVAALFRQATQSLTWTLRLGLARKSSRKLPSEVVAVSNFQVWTHDLHLQESLVMCQSNLSFQHLKNFFSTLTMNLKLPHLLPAASRGGKTYYHTTELHFYWTSSHSFNTGRENTVKCLFIGPLT